VKTSDSIDKLVDALAQAQASMKNAPLNKVNPHFKSKYADLAAIRDATIPHLAKHGLTILQATETSEGGFSLVTRLAHKSGQWIEGEYPLPLVLEKPQAMGSALTYAKRYSWASMVGISADEDDDGNAAQGAAKPAAKKAWRGPLANMKLRSEMTALSERMASHGLATTGDLQAIVDEYSAVIEQAKFDLPDWYEGYQDKRKELSMTLPSGPAMGGGEADPDSPETYQK